MYPAARLGALLVVVSVVLAGCLGSGPAAPGPTSTTTPTAPTTTTTSPTTAVPVSGDFPGIDGGRIADFDSLRAAHERTLLADGAVLTFSSTVGRSDGAMDRTTEHTYRFGPGADQLLVHATEMDGRSLWASTDLYANETVQTMRSERGGETSFTIRPRTMAPSDVVWGLLPWYVAQNAEAVRVNETRSSPDRMVLDATLDRNPTVEGNETLVTLVVSESGIVEEFEFRQALSGEQGIYITRFVVREVGDVTVTEPPWVASVPDSASLLVDLFASITPNGALQLEHIGGGDAVPSGTLVTLQSSDSVVEAAIPDAVAPGESMYVYLDDAGELAVTLSPPDSGSVTPLPSEFTVRVVTTDGVTLFSESLGSQPQPIDE